MEIKVRKIGNSLGVVLPKELLSSLKLDDGDTLFINESPSGFNVTPYNPEFAQQMEVSRKLMKKRRNVLHELAK